MYLYHPLYFLRCLPFLMVFISSWRSNFPQKLFPFSLEKLLLVFLIMQWFSGNENFSVFFYLYDMALYMKIFLFNSWRIFFSRYKILSWWFFFFYCFRDAGPWSSCLYSFRWEVSDDLNYCYPKCNVLSFIGCFNFFFLIFGFYQFDYDVSRIESMFFKM